MNSELIKKYCQYCYNKDFDPSIGITCKLNTPRTKGDKCEDFSPNTSIINREKYQEELIEKKNRKKALFTNMKDIVLVIFLITLGGFIAFESYKLNSDYRYTIAKVKVYSQTGSDPVLGIGGYTCYFNYAFLVNGKRYDGKGSIGNSRAFKLKEPIWPTKFLVRFSTEDPNLNEVMTGTDVSKINFDEIPSRGISPDSLSFYLDGS